MTWRSAALVLLCLFTATLAVSYASPRDAVARGLPPETPPSGALMLVWLVGSGLAVLTIWRDRWPEILIALSTGAAILLPLDPTPALVGWVTVIVRREGRRLFPWTLPTAVATLAATYRDSRGADTETSFWQTLVSAPGEANGPLGLVAVVAISAAVFGVASAGGLVLRVTRRNRELTRRDTDRSVHLDELQATIDRQSERERLAREVHDALGHRLSLLSLHAGALQATASNDEALQRSAGLIQDNARQSVHDLQTLLGSLRGPGRHRDHEERGLADVQQLVDEALAAGAPVIGVFSWASEPLHPAIGHTAYRVVQELLTNARRHAPGLPVRLNVAASPEAGIDISSVNALPHGRELRPSGHGLAGLQERVSIVGGRAQVGVDEQHGAFRVAVWLPWETRA